MKDRVSLNPGRVLVTPETGGDAFHATLTRADNPTQEGDPLNKSTLLKDATAALYGLSDEAVPDDVFLKVYNRLFNDGVMSLSLLWENAAPSSNFSEQTITLTDMDYDFFLICTSSGSAIIKASTAATSGAVTFINKSEQYGRWFSVVAEGISVENATASTINSAGTVYNSFAIPVYIFGIRF